MSAHLEEERGRELHFRLPLQQARPAVLSLLFTQLELQKRSLGVTSYGLSACTMEEVCLRLVLHADCNIIVYSVPAVTRLLFSNM